jgi:hypothetical protein
MVNITLTEQLNASPTTAESSIPVPRTVLLVHRREEEGEGEEEKRCMAGEASAK